MYLGYLEINVWLSRIWKIYLATELQLVIALSLLLLCLIPPCCLWRLFTLLVIKEQFVYCWLSHLKVIVHYLHCTVTEHPAVLVTSIHYINYTTLNPAIILNLLCKNAKAFKLALIPGLMWERSQFSWCCRRIWHLKAVTAVCASAALSRSGEVTLVDN